MFYELNDGLDDDTGLPYIPTEIINCGINKELLPEAELRAYNHRLVSMQLEDISAKDKLFWKIVTRNYSHINFKDIFFCAVVYGLPFFILLKSYDYVQKNNLRQVVYTHSTYKELQEKELARIQANI